MEFPGGPRARDWNRLGGGGGLGVVVKNIRVWTDPIRPGKPGRREGGEVSWMPQIGQGKPKAWDTFIGPHANIAGRTLGSGPRAQVPTVPANLHLLGALPRMTQLGTVARVFPSRLALNQAQHPPLGVSPQSLVLPLHSHRDWVGWRRNIRP